MKTVKCVIVVLVWLSFVELNAHHLNPSGSGRTTLNHREFQASSKEKIKKEDLPKLAIEYLDNSMKGWSIVQAYRVKSRDQKGSEVLEYEVEVKKGTTTQTVKFDKEGNSKQ